MTCLNKDVQSTAVTSLQDAISKSVSICILSINGRDYVDLCSG